MRSLFRTGCVAFIAVLAVAQSSTPRSLDVESFCQISERALALTELEWRDRVQAVELTPQDKSALMDRLSRIGALYSAERRNLYAAFGTSEGEMAKFNKTSREAIADHLKTNTNLQRSLEGLRIKVNALIERFENIADPTRRN